MFASLSALPLQVSKVLLCEVALMKVCTEGSMSAGADWMSRPLSPFNGSSHSSSAVLGLKYGGKVSSAVIL